MPWAPELFSARTLHQLEDKRRRQLVAVPYFDGLLTGELDALVESFAGEPELHHPTRGRIRGERAFETFVVQTRAWLGELPPQAGIAVYVRGQSGRLTAARIYDDVDPPLT